MTGRTLRHAAVGTLSVTVGALLLSAAPAWAASSTTIEQIDTSGEDIRVVVSVSDLGDDESVDTDNVGLTIDGIPIEADTEPVTESSDIEQVAILVLDTSGSMAGTRILAAKEAARDFLGAVPDDVEVGLVTFATNAKVAVAPTTDRAAVADALRGLQAVGSTALYDAVVLASKQVKPADIGTAIVLSDGADDGSNATLSKASSAAKGSGGVFDAIAFGGEQSQLGALEKIAEATNGTVTRAANAAELSAAFDQSAEAISNQFVVTGAIPEEFSGQSATISVTVPVGDNALTDDAFVQIADIASGPAPEDVAPKVVPEPGPLAALADNLIWLAFAGIFLALLVLLYFAFSSATDRERSGSSGVRRRLSIYTLGGAQPVKEQETTVLGDTQVARSAVEFAGKVVAKRDMESVVGAKLDAAAVPLKPAEWLIIHVGLTIATGLLFLLLFGGKVLPTALGMLIGFLVPTFYLSIKESKRTKAFAAGLPDTLQLIAGSLSAGYSMPQAVDTVVREGSPPISTEFNRALVETRLGVPIEDALDGIGERMRSVDFAWVVMAIRIQREVGGNLAEVLTTVAATLRERERLRRQVLVLSAEGRLSAWILGGLPIIFAVYLVLVRPDYLAPMVETFLGWIMIGTGILLLVIGSLWLRKVVKVEV
jgi:tight adherence protein B